VEGENHPKEVSRERNQRERWRGESEKKYPFTFTPGRVNTLKSLESREKVSEFLEIPESPKKVPESPLPLRLSMIWEI
jgi:hypothetical protein